MADTVHVKGLAELQKFLDELPAKIERNIMRGALRAGANVIKEEAKQQLASNGSVKTGELQRGLKVSTRAKAGTVTASVKAKGKHQYIAHMIEFTGAAPHVINPKKGKAVTFGGRMFKAINHPGFKPRPFMRPALDGKAGAALVAVGEAIKKRLTKEGIDATDIEINEE
jgi:HK97 gp10 family phage protein